MTTARHSGRTFARLGLVAVNLLWAVQYPALAVVADQLGPGAIALWQMVGALVVLAPWWAITRRQALTRPAVRARDVADVVLLGAFGIVVPAFALPWGVARSNAANAALLSLTVPVFMTALALPLLGERPTRRGLLGLGIGLAGGAVASLPDLMGGSLARRMGWGNAAVCLGSLGSAFYNVYGKRVSERLGALPVLVGSCATALAGTAVLAGGESAPPWALGAQPGRMLLALAAAGVLSWGLGMLLFLRLLQRLDATSAATSIYLLPAFGVLLSALWLHVLPAPSALLGGLLAAIAVAVTGSSEDRST